MAKPLGKRTIMPKASRPWAMRDPGSVKPVHQDTPKEKREREICLNCKLPGCPSAGCPISTNAVNTGSTRPGPHKKQMPEDFPRWAWTLTAAVLAKQYGVNVKVIARWRKELKEKAAHDAATS